MSGQRLEYEGVVDFGVGWLRMMENRGRERCRYFLWGLIPACRMREFPPDRMRTG